MFTSYPNSTSSNIYLGKINEIALDNKYTKWYNSIITVAIMRDVSVQGEKHHILPRSFRMGGEKDKLNIIKLTYKEHFICHLLLSKMFNGNFRYLMAFAVVRLSKGLLRNSKNKSNVYASRKFEQHKTRIYASLKGIWKDHIWINDDKVSIRKTSDEIDSYLEQGWKLGRLPFKRPTVFDINNGILTKRVLPSEVDSYLVNGWKNGRIKSEKITVTNGVKTKRVFPDQIPEGFKPGSCLDTASGRQWVNNQHENKYLKAGEIIPEGFVLGRIGGSKFAPPKTDKVSITDGVKQKFIKPNDILPLGWTFGTPPKKKYKWKTTENHWRNVKVL